MIDLCLSSVFFQALKYAKTRFLPGFRPDPAGGAYDAPPDLLVGWGGEHPLPIAFSLDAFGILILPLTSLEFVHLALQSKRLDTSGLVYTFRTYMIRLKIAPKIDIALAKCNDKKYHIQ